MPRLLRSLEGRLKLESETFQTEYSPLACTILLDGACIVRLVAFSSIQRSRVLVRLPRAVLGGVQQRKTMDSLSPVKEVEMKSLMQLLECVLADAGTWCRTSTTRDLETISRRLEHEGLSFLTITLPNFCKDFERGLDRGFVAPTDFVGFRRTKEGYLPRIFSGFTELVFNRSTGVLLDAVDVHAVFAIRQLCLLLKKVSLPCSGERERKALDDYVQCENELTTVRAALPDPLFERFRAVARMLWIDTLQGAQQTLLDGEAIPRHGPGATADRISGNQKYDFRSWHERLEPFFPSDAYILPNLGWVHKLEEVEFIEPGSEQPVRVILVPKTLKSPRVIAMEPLCMQYAQQSLLPLLVESIENGRLTKERINFSRQGPNQRLARYASSTGRLATLDMKEASDRVSVWLVESMLSGVPYLRDAIMACRSTTSDVPGLGILSLTKFASMGSALCFPIEAMVFFTIALTVGLQEQGLPLTPRNLKKVSRGVRVYGDDIIIPVESVQSYCEALGLFGLRVNSDKSFWTGKFRESCGADWYDGTQVTPVYCRRLGPRSRRDASEILSWISMSNLFYEKGYWKACQFCRDWVESLRIPLPVVDATSPLHGRLSYTFSYMEERSCPTLHRPLCKGVVVRAVPRKSSIDDMPALLKCLLKTSGKPFLDSKHLERHGRPDSVDIKIRWATPF